MEGAARRGATPPADDAHPVVGAWESQGTSRGGFGGVLQFLPAGEILGRAVVMLEGTYTRTGSKLVVHIGGDGAPQDAAYELVRAGSGYARRAAQGEENLLQRMEGPPGSTTDDLVGAWGYNHYAGTRAYESFESTGAWRFRLPLALRPKLGRWTARSPLVVVWSAEDGTTKEARVEQQPGGVPELWVEGDRYNRVPGELWYPIR